MLQRSPKRGRWRRQEAKRRNQRRYEARQRAGIGLYPVPVTSNDIDVLIGLHYLREGAESNRERVKRWQP